MPSYHLIEQEATRIEDAFRRDKRNGRRILNETLGQPSRTGDGAEHDDDVTGLGRYRGLCGVCRPIVAAEQKQRRASKVEATAARYLVGERDMDGMRDEVKARTDQKGKLRAACLALADKADRLEDALEERNAARVHAQAVLSEFKEGLQLVGRVAQSLVNIRAEAPAD